MAAELNLSTSVAIGGIILILLVVLPNLVLSFLFKIEHDEFYSKWKKDGKPIMLPYWFPLKEFKNSEFNHFSWVIGYKWLLKTPTWIKGHKSAYKLLKIFRLMSFSLFIGILILFLIIALFGPRPA